MRIIPQTLWVRTVLIMLLGLGFFHLFSLWIYQIFEASAHGMPDSHNVVISTTAMAVGVVLISIFLVRSLTEPLRNLAQAARQIGQSHQAPVAVVGPREIRDVATAYNDMQARIRKLLDERTQTLAAVSHDLKTPITRLRLRAEFIADFDIREKMEKDLQEMEDMLNSTLVFLRGDSSSEPTRRVDLSALIETICDDFSDCGSNVALDAQFSVIVDGKYLDLKRAFINLIDNAIKHGGGAEVSVREHDSHLCVTIEDSGPGIPPDQLEAVFGPFYRLEASRNRSTGGTGLGLTVARSILRSHGGDVNLINRTEGGLKVTVWLPTSMQVQ